LGVRSDDMNCEVPGQREGAVESDEQRKTKRARPSSRKRASRRDRQIKRE
jgi:hypothetical protein